MAKQPNSDTVAPAAPETIDPAAVAAAEPGMAGAGAEQPPQVAPAPVDSDPEVAVTVLDALDHDGVVYATGDLATMRSSAAAALARLGVVAV